MSAKSSSELTKRLLTAIPLGGAILAAMAYADTWIVGLIVAVFTVVGTMEFEKMLRKTGVELDLTWMIGAAVVLSLGAAFLGGQGLTALTVVVFFGFLFYYLVFFPVAAQKPLESAGYAALGLMWVIWGLNHLTLLHGLDQGKWILFLMVLTIWISDTAAYFTGKRFGKRKLAPLVSPNKTWEGSIGGLIGAGLFAAWFGSTLIDGLNFFEGLLAGVLIAAAGQLGDLAESRLKRICDVKDSGTLLPGHGGVLDRVDGFLPAAPVAYCLLPILIAY